MYRDYHFKYKLGHVGDMATEWWDEQDWKNHRKRVTELKASGEYEKEVDICYTLSHCPELDDTHILRDKIESGKCTAQFLVFDVSYFVVLLN